MRIVPAFVPAHKVGLVLAELTIWHRVNAKHLTIEPRPSSEILASICLSTGLDETTSTESGDDGESASDTGVSFGFSFSPAEVLQRKKNH